MRDHAKLLIPIGTQINRLVLENNIQRSPNSSNPALTNHNVIAMYVRGVKAILKF